MVFRAMPNVLFLVQGILNLVRMIYLDGIAQLLTGMDIILQK